MSSIMAAVTSKSSPQLPAFLQNTKSALHEKYIDLEWQQRHRLAQGSMQQTFQQHQQLSAEAESNGAWPASPSPMSPPFWSPPGSPINVTMPSGAQQIVSPYARPSGEDILKRNRYLNIDPYLSNRVHLRVPDGFSDYINASPIVLKGKGNDGNLRSYIATQGPKETSTSHLWRMVWHETKSVAVIVMLTQTHEAGREKCFQYFPSDESDPTLDVSSTDQGDEFKATVDLVSSHFDETSRSTVRELRLNVVEEEGTEARSKPVWHFLYEVWPDFLVPQDEDREALLQLIQHSAEKIVAAGDDISTNPRIVHCSAGVGRSGTFIALDYLLKELQDGVLDHVGNEDDPIAEVVDDMRKQRMMMVQAEVQFHFLYETMKEQWLAMHGQKEK